MPWDRASRNSAGGNAVWCLIKNLRISGVRSISEPVTRERAPPKEKNRAVHDDIGGNVAWFSVLNLKFATGGAAGQVPEKILGDCFLVYGTGFASQGV